MNVSRYKQKAEEDKKVALEAQEKIAEQVRSSSSSSRRSSSTSSSSSSGSSNSSSK
jgi:hypothetical protein